MPLDQEPAYRGSSKMPSCKQLVALLLMPLCCFLTLLQLDLHLIQTWGVADCSKVVLNFGTLLHSRLQQLPLVMVQQVLQLLESPRSLAQKQTVAQALLILPQAFLQQVLLGLAGRGQGVVFRLVAAFRARSCLFPAWVPRRRRKNPVPPGDHLDLCQRWMLCRETRPRLRCLKDYQVRLPRSGASARPALGPWCTETSVQELLLECHPVVLRILLARCLPDEVIASSKRNEQLQKPLGTASKQSGLADRRRRLGPQFAKLSPHSPT